MKSVKLISFAIAMLFCAACVAQQPSASEQIVNKTKIVFRNCSTPTKEPLYILDGKPVSAKEIQNMNPEAIESMTILKDSAASQFCNRQTNGIIIIKTQKYSKRELRKMKKKG